MLAKGNKRVARVTLMILLGLSMGCGDSLPGLPDSGAGDVLVEADGMAWDTRVPGSDAGVPGSDAGVPTSDALVADTTIDTGTVDTTVDTGTVDTTVDTGSVDTTVDTTVDTGSVDTTVDTTVDTGSVDTTVDTTVDTGSVDTTVDTTVDTGSCADDDHDGICNAADQCPGEDDTIDTDSNNTPDCLENMLLNGAFDEELDPWGPFGVSATVWVPDDQYGSVYSGSMRIDLTVLQQSGLIAESRQCVDVSAPVPATIAVFANVRRAADSVGVQRANIYLHFLGDLNCVQASQVGYNSVSSIELLDSWQMLEKRGIPVPAGTKSIRFRISNGT
ncbi:MAG: hypothetical protein JRH20_23045, partial [Deltaproteobacteria bacterium]|nr:hypothetical protein [Deltaproteobacteria bacterium]